MSIQFTIPSWYVLAPIYIGLVVYFGMKAFKLKVFSARKFILLIVFSFYSLSVLHFVIFPIDVNIGKFANQTAWYKTINYIPLLTIDIKTFILNIIMLAPLGFGLPLLNSNFNRSAAIAKIAFGLSFSLEVLQMIIRVTLGSGRSTDINDLIANTLGAVLGFLVYKTLIKVKPAGHLADR